MKSLTDNANEITLLAGLVLVMVALWPTLGRLSLAAPGLVLAYLGLPVRQRFIARETDASPDKHPRRRAKEIRPPEMPFIP